MANNPEKWIKCHFCPEWDYVENATFTANASYCTECWAELTEAEQEAALNV